MDPDDPINVELGDGSYVAVGPTAIVAISAKVTSRKRDIGFGAIGTELSAAAPPDHS